MTLYMDRANERRVIYETVVARVRVKVASETQPSSDVDDDRQPTKHV